MSKKNLNETEICQNFITPAIARAGWDQYTLPGVPPLPARLTLLARPTGRCRFDGRAADPVRSTSADGVTVP
jgi:type I site-specific restriction endonuclease